MQMKNHHENFFFGGGALLVLKKDGPLFAMKIIGQPHTKSCQLNFHWNFFSRPHSESQKF